MTDLAIRNATIVTSGSRFQADLGISDGKIVQIGQVADADRVIDASGKLVLPGGVDAHVHLTPADVAEGTFTWVDDFESGSRAAAAGGITTIGNMTFPRPGEDLLSALDRTQANASAMSIVDFILHPVLMEPTPANLAQIGELAGRGHTSLKIFMILSGFASDPLAFLRAMAEAGKSGVLTLVHCEDGCVISFLVEKLVRQGKGGTDHYSWSRPIYSEAVAVARAVAFCEAAEAPIYLVHISSREALQEAHKARARGLPVFVETRPDYLHLTSQWLEGPEGVLYTGNPPLRERDDVEALWSALRTGDVQTCCTDHAPWNRADKLAATNVGDVPSGVADLDTMLPMLFSQGVLKHRLSLEQFVDASSTNAAKLFGLYPAKGTVAVGSDADLAIWDPNDTRVIKAQDCFSKADYTIYEGWEVKGWPQYTISRGEVIYENGKITAQPGRGRLAPRQSFGALEGV
jgi:dihydropyrimidinase